MKKIFHTLTILLAIFFFAGCAQEDSPAAALNDIKIALETRDAEKLSTRVDLEKFFAATYDATTLALAEHYDEFQAKYPDDPYFRQDADFLTAYNAEHRTRHLNFLRGVSDSFFANLPAPTTPEENPTAYVANEFEKIRRASTAEILETRIDGERAIVVVDVQGDNSLSGQFIGRLRFELAFRRNEKKFWQLDAIKNLDALMPALVDRAELIWVTFF